MSWLAAGGSGLIAGVGVLATAWAARGGSRRWPAVTALLLGAEEAGVRGDPRFCALAGALATGVSALVLLPPLVALSSGQRGFALLLGAPLGALALAALADLFARLGFWQRRVARAAQTSELGELLERARAQVALAARHMGAERRDTVDELGASLEDYAQRLARGEVEELAERIEDVIALARSCLLAEGREAASVLGVSPDASPAEARAIYQAMTRLYRGPEALPGVDPAKLDELAAAFARLELSMALSAPGEPSREPALAAARAERGEREAPPAEVDAPAAEVDAPAAEVDAPAAEVDAPAAEEAARRAA